MSEPRRQVLTVTQLQALLEQVPDKSMPVVLDSSFEIRDGVWCFGDAGKVAVGFKNVMIQAMDDLEPEQFNTITFPEEDDGSDTSNPTT